MGKSFFNFFLTITSISLLLISITSVDSKKGFSIKMIHRDSKESPLYPGDHLTRDERFQRLVEQSKAQARFIESQILLQQNITRSMDPEVARLPVVYESRMFYVAQIGLGTFLGEQQSFKNYYLMIDSASAQSWLQCDGATKAFNQDDPLYPWRNSMTYRPVPCNTHPLCRGDKCNVDGQCTYSERYATGSTSSGIIAEEKFTLGSDTGGVENIELQIGCGLLQENFGNFIGDNHLHGKPDLIAGILGLGSGNWSFLNQLGAVGQGKFSYCFPPFGNNIEAPSTYLRFGADASIGGMGQRVYKTPFVVVPGSEIQPYYLNLEDISVGTKRIRFPIGTFKINRRGEGGTIIDSGTPWSMMYKDHFDKVVDFVKAHFNKVGVEYIGSIQYFDACFRLPRTFDTTIFPSIKLHFQRADYVISDFKTNFFMASHEIVCLAYSRRNTTGPGVPHFVLGAMQQTNKQILYNIMDKSLSFATKNCELGS